MTIHVSPERRIDVTLARLAADHGRCRMKSVVTSTENRGGRLL